MKQAISINVNGVDHASEVEPRVLLVHFLRDVLGLTGTHVGCETSICGACTVLAVQCDGAQITTIEGMVGDDGTLHPLQEGFWANHGLQCGYCTPGMIMAAADLLARRTGDGPISEEEVRKGLEGNLCRCTGYQNIVKAVQAAAEAQRGVAA